MIPSKRNTLAVVQSLLDQQKPAPSREQVQSLKKSPKGVSIKTAISALSPLPSFVTEAVATAHNKTIDQAETYAKKFNKLGDKKFNEQYAHLANLWDSDLVTLYTGGSQGRTKLPMTDPKKQRSQLLNEYNVLLKAKGIATVKTFKGTQLQLQQRIDKLKQSIQVDSIKPWKVYPTAVAKGAYKDEEEAKLRTGHTTSGPSSAVAKQKKQQARFIDQRVQTPSKSKSTRPTANLSTGDVFRIVDLAREHALNPKALRKKSKLERYRVQLEPLQVGKHLYPIRSKGVVLRILTQDSRRKPSMA